MKNARIIPCLDVTDGRVVKGINFVGLRDAGDPFELAARYDDTKLYSEAKTDIIRAIETKAARVQR